MSVFIWAILAVVFVSDFVSDFTRAAMGLDNRFSLGRIWGTRLYEWLERRRADKCRKCGKRLEYGVNADTFRRGVCCQCEGH
jgi:hypothetical protein